MRIDLEHNMSTISPQNLEAIKREAFLVSKETMSWYVEPPTEPVLLLPYLYWCRVMDITFALCGMFVFLFILPILALLIYFDSPGPIFYNQERVGYKGRKFRMYKLRSMYSNSQHAEQVPWSTKGDTRVTKIGRFLRATHIDELPQVFNILQGEMSLIGPRPELPTSVSELEEVNPLYHHRFGVKPGLTGLTQVMYGYGNTSQEELIKLHYDLYYIEHRSFRLDMYILSKTISEVILHHGI